MTGLGKDGIWRTCKFDYHKDNDTLRPGMSLLKFSFFNSK